jgi:hypothetical protein
LTFMSRLRFWEAFVRRCGLVAACTIVLLPLAACGDSNGSEPRPASRETHEGSPEESPEFAFADYDFERVTRKDCENPERLGNKRSITMKTPDIIGAALFIPDCLTDVGSDKISVTIDNTSGSLHNFIVEGNEFELVIQPDSRKSIKIVLDQQPVIYFACTIHRRTMFGAFFR